MTENSETPLWKRLRDQVAQGRVFRLNIGDPTDVDQATYADRLFSDGVATISDWGLWESDITLAEDGKEVTADNVVAPFADPLKGEIQWDTIRDRIHEEHYSSRDTKVKAGHAAGCIRMFVDDLDIGDILLGNFPSGIVPGIVDGPAIYDSSSEYIEFAPSHVLHRRINWAAVNGDPLTVSSDLLPPGFGPGRRTITQVQNPESMAEVLRFFEWIGGNT